ncbi:MAG: signal recognition particle-docking protein FtsY [Acidimicrobiia bacterium]|nr:signal recognition particle-docking protein FtsY [Acidimicrobiia bacterium]
MEWQYLVLVALVVAFGVAVLVVSRRRAARTVEPPSVTPPAPPTAPPQPSMPGAVDVLEPDVSEPPVVLEPPTLRQRMGRARAALAGAFAGIRSRDRITDETWDELEEALLRADVGIGVTTRLLDDLRGRVKEQGITEPDALLDALQAEMRGQLVDTDRSLPTPAGDDGHPDVWLFVGVNGVGKTTTIGKVAEQQQRAGHRVLLAAGDTFRAAAVEQLTTWAERSGAEVVRGAEGGDPSAVVFDAVERAASRGVELVLADTAGRLHTKTNLMDELRKVRRVAEKGAGRVTEVLLVIDATTGQNGLAQAREFGDATQVTGVVLTKLDGSARGGIVFAVETELGIPVKLVGVGETIDDLLPFDPDDFVAGLF